MKSAQKLGVVVALFVSATIGFTFNTVQAGQITSAVPAATPPDPTEVRDNRDLSRFGIVRYDAPQPQDPKEFVKRQTTSQRYDNQEWVYKTINNSWTAGIGKIKDDPLPPLIPTEESNLIVVGEVVDANAFMSNDRQGVYTEFRIRVEHVLKTAGNKTKPKIIIADREGGVVVYPNGQRILYQNSNMGLPLRNSKYLFFLIRDDQSPNYKILTSYDVSTDKVRRMELGHSFDEFKELDSAKFIEMVRNRITR